MHKLFLFFFNLSFFMIYTNYIENMETGILLKVIEYSIIFIIFGNMQAYLANFYRRKRFADSRELLRLSVTDSLTGIYNRCPSKKMRIQNHCCKERINSFTKLKNKARILLYVKLAKLGNR